MAGQQGGGGGQDSENAYTPLWILVIVFVICALIWYFFGAQLKMAFIALKKYEVVAISFFINDQNIHRAQLGLNMVTPDTLSWEYTSIISTYIGQYLLYPICFLLLILGIIMFRNSAGMRYTKSYNMDMLVHQEKENWPQIAPIADIDLMNEEINKGPWAMSMNPMQFARHHKLLKVELVPDRKASWRSEGIAKATLIREATTQVFASQLGPLWSGVDSLPPHTKALYAAFLARAEHDTDACRGYLAKLSRTAAKGTIDYSDTDILIKKYSGCKAAQLAQTRHAYVLTVMASMLVLGRVDGVLASADFLWIKPLDRRLWYTLNCVGRQVAVPEVGGVFAHWIAEKEMGRALTVPMINQAVDALDKAVANMVYIAEENEDIPPAEMG